MCSTCARHDHRGPEEDTLDDEGTWNTSCWLACAQYARMKGGGELWQVISTNQRKKSQLFAPSNKLYTDDALWKLAQAYYIYCGVQAEKMNGATSHVGRKGFGNMCSRLGIPFIASVCWHQRLIV